MLFIKMLKIIIPASNWAPKKEESFKLNLNATTTLGSCTICDIKLNRKSIDDVHLILKYDKAAGEILIRDNRTESGTFQVNRNEALNPRTFYKFALGNEPVKLKTGDVEIEITSDPEPVNLRNPSV